jgi:hypothetical protein
MAVCQEYQFFVTLLHHFPGSSGLNENPLIPKRCRDIGNFDEAQILSTPSPRTPPIPTLPDLPILVKARIQSGAVSDNGAV